MKRLLIILTLLLLASTTYAAYWLNDSYSMGGGLAANKMRTIITRSNGAAVDTVKDSTITATINNIVRFKTWAVDSLVPHCISHVYMTADGDTFPEQVCDIYPTEFSQYARRGVANSQAVRDSMDEAAQFGAGSSGGCPDSVGNAWTIVAWDSVNNVEVTNAIITLKSSVSSSVPLAQATSPFTFTKSSGSAVVVIEANGVTFPVRSFTISGTRVDTINGGGMIVVAAPSPDKATVYGTVDCYSCFVRFTLDAPSAVIDTSTGYLISQKVYDLKTNAAGSFQQALPKTENMIYLSGTQKLHPKWRVVISRTNVALESNWGQPFSIDADSTELNIGELFQ